jgi:hypothetical protein
MMDTDHIENETIGAHRAGPGVPDWAGLMPVGVAALGAPSRPVERLIGTQAAVYRLIVALGQLRLPRWKSRRETRYPAAASPHV